MMATPAKKEHAAPPAQRHTIAAVPKPGSGEHIGGMPEVSPRKGSAPHVSTTTKPVDTPKLPAINSMQPLSRQSSLESTSSARRKTSVSEADVDHLARFATFNRNPSFRSTGPVDAEAAAAAVTPVVETDSQAIDARRRESMKKMEAMTHNKAVKEAIHNSFKAFTQDISADADAENKLSQVLIHAKESGMPVEKIFSFFAPHEDSVEVNEEDFMHGLQQLNSDHFSLTLDDMKLLIDKFDTNKDKKISLEEFVNFALNIPHVSWRAERSRRKSLGASGDAHSSVLQSARRGSRDVGNLHPPLHPNIGAHGSAAERRKSVDRRPSLSKDRRPSLGHRSSSLKGKLSARDPPAAAGEASAEAGATNDPRAQEVVEIPFVMETSKLMWRTREDIIVRVHVLKDPPIIALVTHNEKNHEDNPTLYVAADRIPVDHTSLEGTVAENVHKTRGTTPADLDPHELAPLMEQARRDHMIHYLIQRLQLEDVTKDPGTTTKHVVLVKQTGDEWDTLVMEKPAHVKEPPTIGCMRHTSIEDFRRKSLEIEKMSSEIRRHSLDANKLVLEAEEITAHAPHMVEETIPEGTTAELQNDEQA